MARTVDARLDVREVDGEPFGDIVAILDDLGAAETFELIAPFEPIPLYGELADRGFEHETVEDDGLYRVYIEHA